MTSCSPTKLGDMNVCSGFSFSGQQLFDYWCDFNCPSTYESFLYNVNGELKYNPERQSTLQSNVTNLFNTYFKTNPLTNPTDPRYNPFQENLLALCTDSKLPGACENFLNGYCSSSSRQEVINSRTLTNFCGCYAPPDEKILEVTKNPACDPLCRRAGTSQKADLTTGDLKLCSQDVCVIDNVTINVSNSFIAGGVGFVNICPACGQNSPDGCFCLISSPNISKTMTDIGAYSISQYCAGNSICQITDGSGNVISSGSCDNIPEGPSFTQSAYFPGWLPIFLVLAFLILVVIIFLATKYL